jgi:TolB-like protein/Tfp pilus assembly protein PilF
MPVRKPPIPVTEDANAAARQQLDRILGSRTFQPADRLKRFLEFIVHQTLAGRGDRLKEYVIAVDVFGKEDAFDPRTDPLVRVQARRLRARLAKYYREEGEQDEVLIELPKGGYAPVFKTRDKTAMHKRSIAATLALRNSVSVLPFSDDTPDRTLDYFCNGLRDEVIHRLARVEALRVVASEHGSRRDALQAADRLDVAMLITGSVRSSGERLRITIHLLDGVAGCYLWSESLDTTLADPLAAQEQVAGAIVERVTPELSGAVERSWTRRRGENLAAHNLCLQGRYHLNQRTEEALQKALEFFEKAIAEDPQYALAHSGLADTYGLLGHYAVLPPAEVWTRAASSAATAVMLDGNLAEARSSLAHVKSTQDWDWVGAEREFQRAISLNPRYPTAHHWYAMSCLVPLQRLEQALEEMQIAQALDPISSIIARDLAAIHYYRRDFEAALEQCDHTIELNPHFSPAYWLLGFIQEQRGELDESIAAFQRAVHLSPQSPRMQSALARALVVSGKRQAAIKMLKALQEWSQKRYVSPFEFAAIHLALGEHDRGFTWLSRAVDDRAFEMTAIRVDPRVQAVSGDPRFADIVKRLGVD